ncbi:MAG TPA: sigma-54 dependent transcriptional regulator [Chitinophagaceae bacterium]|nr:sigma-54 dependent transcriptional regulator [Chitinophagaceae bacterium]
MNKKVLIIDDDMDLCLLLGKLLNKNGYETEAAYTGHKGITRFSEKKFDAVICDYRLGDMEGKNVLTELKKADPGVIVLIITGYSDIKTAVELIKLGAFDYISKPLIPDEVLSILNKAFQQPAGTAPGETAAVVTKKASSDTSRYQNEQFMVGKAATTRALYNQIEIVAPTNYSIILYGESGTGKEVIARTIHERSGRRDKPFVAMDCGTLSKELAGSELFGHVKGAFTGALQDKEGHFELADGGTLFLDEVGNLSLEVQATLLRVIQERKFKRVGGNKEMNVDVRIIVASNESLQDGYRRGKFREDLYHRFNEFSINLPPLRSRKEDIMEFAAFFLAKTNAELGKDVSGYEEDVLQKFMEYGWPGNLREFRNVVRRAVLLTPPGEKINISCLPWEITTDSTSVTVAATLSQPVTNTTEAKPMPLDLKNAATKAEYETIMSVLQKVNFNKKKAAELLNIDRKTLYNKIKNFQD